MSGWRAGGLALMLLMAGGTAPATPTPPPARTVSLTVYGDDPCPQSSADEIVVCAREPEGERYRIPKRLRDRKATEESGARSWTDRVATVEEAGRTARPNSCSAVGAGGQTGCTQAMLRQWFEARRAARDAASDAP